MQYEEAVNTLVELGWERERLHRVYSDVVDVWGTVMYFLFDEEDALQYIGITSDLRRRLHAHRIGKGISNHPHSYAIWIDMREMYLGRRITQVESEMIQLFEPPQNRACRRARS